MLKRFFLNFASSFVGAWLALVLFVAVAVVVTIAAIGKIAISSATSESIEKHSILTIELSGEIAERGGAPDFSLITLARQDISQAQSLQTLLTAIREAAGNKDIDAIYIKCNGVMASPATLDALRNALLEFKKDSKGKKIIAYGGTVSQGDYFVASVADSIFLNPEGMIELKGMSGTVPYYKSLLDKLGVEFQVVKVGTFKSAVEPYIMDHMSEPARAQLDTLYGTLWNRISGDIATSRNIKQSLIDTLINRDYILFTGSELVKQNGLVDKVVYQRHLDATFGAITGKDPDNINYISPATMAQQSSANIASLSTKNQIAVLYCTGEISELNNNGINCDVIVPEILKLAKEDNVKGLVMRVNSPGGSVYGSEQIWEALEYFKSTGKPFAVSMGDYAASGGYYISCGADRIFANPLTITGSIGIFGMFPNVQGLEEKLGVNMETTATNPPGVVEIPFKPLTEGQYAAAQKMVERGYEQFTGRVAKGRHMNIDQVKRIAEGRVWSAITAQQIGLVDELGNLQDAVKWVAAKAGIEDNYNLGSYPVQEPSIWDYLPTGLQGRMVELVVERGGKDLTNGTASFVRMLLLNKPVQARMIPLFIYL